MAPKILCSGWYATNKTREYRTFGEDEIRGAGFRALWWHSVDEFIKPNRAFVVDSASEILPDDNTLSSTPSTWLRLTTNPGHAQTTSHQYSGWMTSVLLGLEYTLASDADYFLYVEQDVLVYGKDFTSILEAELAKHPFVFGSGLGTPWPLQQSLFAIRKDHIREFLVGIHRLKNTDRQLPPELKFCLGSTQTRLTYSLLRYLFRPGRTINGRAHRAGKELLKWQSSFGLLPFGYGRTRPINFNDSVFYFQHASKEELVTYQKLCGLH